MRLKKIKLPALLLGFVCLSVSLKAQNFTFNCTKDTLIAGCTFTPCFTLRAVVPDIHGLTDSYVLNPVTNGTSACLPVYVDPSITGTSTNLTTDDKYSAVIPIGFPFPFYGTYYNSLVISTNGVISFNPALAGSDAEYSLLNGTTPVNLPSTFYDEALIMGPFHDIDIGVTTSPNRKIQYTTVGAAPNRKWIVSFYKIPLYSNPATLCQNLIENTHQIVLYESTGIIEVLIFSKQICSSWQGGRAMVGIQNFARNQGMMAPGRKASDPAWGSVNMNESWRFVPSGGASLFKRVELYDINNVLIATGTANPTGDGKLEALFPNICPPANAVTSYIIKSVYSKIDDPAVEIAGTDTFRVTRSAATDLNATASSTQSDCGQDNGTITINVPAGIGTAPFKYSIDGGTLQTSNTFTGLAARSHQVHVEDASGCSSDFSAAVTSSGVLNVTYTKSDASCSGGNNGSITVNPPIGTAPITYSINGGPFSTNNVFSNLAPATYTVSVKDAAGCEKTGISITITSGPYLTFTHTVTPTSCTGANNGSIKINSVNGTAPFEYSINAGSYQASPAFSNLQGNATYFIRVKDAIGCVSDFVAINVPQGAGTLNGTATGTATSCSGASDGSITVTPTTGSGPYEYSINSGGAWQTSNVFSGLPAAGYTILIREGGLCTSNPINVTVSAGAVLTGTVASTPTACTGVNNGAITVTPSNGIGPYEYSLDGGAFQSSATFTGVGAGPHNVVIKNASCTSGNLGVTVAAGSVVTATTGTTNTSCSGAADGSITVTPTNGSAPYQYALDGGTYQSSNTFADVTAGAHTVIVKDNFGCVSAPINAPVTAGPVLTGTAVSAAATCSGVNNGTITVTPAAGFTGPFEYSLDGGAFQSPNTFTGLAAASYTVRIRNAAGCVSGNISVVIGTGTGLTATTSMTNTSCSGAADGSITITPTNGSAPYQYSLDGGVFQSSNTFTGVTAGAHTVAVKDNLGCTSPVSAPVTAGPVLTGTAVSTSTACPGMNNGTITVTPASGFTGPFEYSLDGSAYQSSNVFTGLPATSHTVRIRNASGCVSADIAVNVAAGLAVAGTITTSNTSCSGASDGVITVTPVNGTGPYQYSLDAGAFQAGATFSGVAAGPHSIVVRDNFGCVSASINAPVTAGPVLTGTAASTSTACAGVSNGTITVTPATGFTGPFEYSLDGGPYQSSNTFTGVTATGHSVKIRNTAGCISGDITVTVTAGAELTGGAVSTPATCNGVSNGTVTVTPSNGSGPYQYALNGGAFQASNVFTGLSANTYTVTIKDAFDCVSAAIPVTVSQPAAVAATTPAVQNVSCYGGANGVITAGATGGTTPYSYSLDNATFQPGNLFNVPAGTYMIYVKDAMGCTASYPNVLVTQPAAMSASAISTVNATCSGGSDGVIEVTASGGVTPYQYSVDGATFQSSHLLNVTAGTYNNVTVKDANGCTFIIPTGVVVGMTDNLTVSVTTPAPICEGSNVQLEVISNATSYTWTSSPAGASLAGANPIVAPATTTVYTVLAVLGNCSRPASVTVTVMPAPVPDAGADAEICFGQNASLQGSGGVTYSWTPATYLNDNTSAAPQVTGPRSTITYSLNVVDANNCSSLMPDKVTVKVVPPIKVMILPADTIVYPGSQFRLQALSSGTDYTWTPATGLDNPTVPDPVVTAPLLEGAEVVYRLQVSTPAGCKGEEKTATVRVYKGPDIYVVTAFTPNNDGRNDIFIPIPVGIKQLNYFRVFNRWGRVIFSTSTLNKGWDGKIGGLEQGAGVYVWMIEGITDTGVLISKKGTVTLIR